LTISARKRHVKALKLVHLVEKKVRSMPPITFTDDNFKALDPDHDDLMVISIEAEYGIGKLLVNQGSSVNILYWKTFQRMNLSEDLIVPYNEQIVDFSGKRVDTRGYLDLRTRIGSRKNDREVRVRYILVEANISYNVLLGRYCLNAFGTIVSTIHLAMKFPSDKGTICTVYADQQIARQCYAARLKIVSYNRSRKQHRSEVVDRMAAKPNHQVGMVVETRGRGPLSHSHQPEQGPICLDVYRHAEHPSQCHVA